MKVFKFGGASVKDAAAVKNATQIVSMCPQDKLIVVVSAMGKTTNKLEELVDALWKQDQATFVSIVADLKTFHFEIMKGLFDDVSLPIYHQMEEQFQLLGRKFTELKSDNRDFLYDQLVSLGEVFSTMIVEAYFRASSVQSAWVDARHMIRTDNTFREGEVDWKQTEQLVQQVMIPKFSQAAVLVSQGFIGHTSEGFSTTLGREGSDYTAAIFAYCTAAESVTIWKDVDGMLNADPRLFPDSVKLDMISYKEAIELAYYGASVIHPKTIKPLQNKNIPLYVKSFIHPSASGTVIQADTSKDAMIPSFIFKKDQVLMSFSPRDFSFIDEGNFVGIFQQLTALGVKVNLMQNTALSFSIVFDKSRINPIIVHDAFAANYEVRFNEDLELVTIRHFDQATIDKTTKNKEILLDQRTRQTIRMVVKSN